MDDSNLNDAPVTDSLDSVQDDSGLSAGFAKVRGGEPHTDVNDAEITPAEAVGPEVTAAPEVEATPDPEPPEEMIAGMKASELKALLAKSAEVDQLKALIEQNNQKMYGKLGEYQKKINELKQVSTAKIGKDSLKRLSAEFPDLAELLADDLAEAIQASPSGLDQDHVDNLVNQRMVTAQQEMEKKLIAIAHRDWKQVLTSDDWKAWVSTQAAERKAEIETTWDSAILADAISDYKNAKNASAEKAAQTQQRRANKLERNVMPNGVPASGPMRLPDERGLSAGFNKVRRSA
jgi:hypothetical protein